MLPPPRLSALCALAVAVAACRNKGETGAETDGDGTDSAEICATTWYLDADGDGYGDRAEPVVACTEPEGTTANASDCDDGDANVHPEAQERCGGGDEDCDGRIDDADSDLADPTLWYVDADGDGAGSETVTASACEAPEGYVANAGDCDDHDAVSGGVPTWYTDSDGDGYGADESAVLSCDPPESGVALGGDCDDSNTSYHPEADEWCDDGLDTDCDGSEDDGDALDAGTWYPDADADGWGDDATPVGACTAPDGSLSSGGDCDDSDAGVNPDAVELCGDGIDQDCDGGPGSSCGLVGDYAVADADVVLSNGGTGSYFGYSVAGGVDVDGDGYGDIALGEVTEATVYVVNGPLSSGTLSESTANATWTGSRSTYAGRAVAWAGDVDGDGEVELAIGANDADLGSSVGAVYLVDGAWSGAGSLRADAISLLGGAGDKTANALAGLGDVDGDGVDDLLVGSPEAGSTSGGQATLLLGPLTASGALADGDATFSGGPGDNAGCGVGGVGDWDGDGLADLGVGASGSDAGEDDGGAVFVLAGTSSGELALPDSAGLASALGGSFGDGVGCAFAGPGDLDGDGGPDLVVSGEDTHAIFEVRGPFSGTLDLDYADAIWTTPTEVTSLVAAGDVDADGWTDLLVGDSGYASDAGLVSLLGGPLVDGDHAMSDATARFSGPSTRENVGWRVSTAGDTNGDGADDVLIGAYDADDSWVFLGGGR